MTGPERPPTPPKNVLSAGAERKGGSVVKGVKGDPAREARIKAALKANLARRKSQARIRGSAGPTTGNDINE